MIEDMVRPLRRYADFRGRARPREYWLFILLTWLILGPIVLAGMALGWSGVDAKGKLDPLPAHAGMLDIVMTALLSLVVVALLLPWLAVQVRRLHDTNRSAWYLLWNLVPTFGSIVLMVLMLLPGIEGPNRYGDDPAAEVDEWGRVIDRRRPVREPRDRFGPA